MRFAELQRRARIWGLAWLCMCPISACDDTLEGKDDDEQDSAALSSGSSGSSSGGGGRRRQSSSSSARTQHVDVAECKLSCDDDGDDCKNDCDADDESCNQRCDNDRYDCRMACEDVECHPCDSDCDPCKDDCHPCADDCDPCDDDCRPCGDDCDPCDDECHPCADDCDPCDDDCHPCDHSCQSCDHCGDCDPDCDNTCHESCGGCDDNDCQDSCNHQCKNSCGDDDDCKADCADDCKMSCGGGGHGNAGSGGHGNAGSGGHGGDAGQGDDGDTMSVTIQFKARVGDADFACGQTYPGIGSKSTKVTPTDMRMFVQDIKLITAGGDEVDLQLNPRAPYQSEEVVLLDFENGKGECIEGNSGTNTKITGTVPTDNYVGISFTNGVPEQLNHVDPTTAQDPLKKFGGLSWGWLGGFRFTKIELKQLSQPGEPYGIGLLHIGSTACTSDPNAGTIECAKPNRNRIELRDFDPDSDVIVFDAAAVFEDTDMTETAECHSTGEYCESMFDAFGLSFETGKPIDRQSAFSVE